MSDNWTTFVSNSDDRVEVGGGEGYIGIGIRGWDGGDDGDETAFYSYMSITDSFRFLALFSRRMLYAVYHTLVGKLERE